MNRAALDRIATAVLYEGYLLYPYRASAVKNRQRFNFGTLYPAAWAAAQNERTSMQTEVLVRGHEPRVEGAVRFLHLVEKPSPAGPWHQAREREVPIPESGVARLSFPPTEEGQRHAGGVIEVLSTRVGDDLHRFTVRVRNDGELDPGATRDEALLHALVSAHTLLGAASGEFVSLLDPPEDAASAAARCENTGTWPVLVGEPGRRDTMLSSPIILYDYPAVAPESPGDLFDAAEIDEILSLRIITLTDAEKREARETDPRARALLDRTEGLSQADLIRLHGTLRDPHALGELRPGAHVRIKPRTGGDVFDLALAGKAATVAAVERDDEGRLLFAVTVDDDPGRDLGAFGHRFFFRADEVEPLP
jgi:hypothetical protein